MADNKEIFVLTQMSEFDKSDKIDQQTDIIALQEGKNVRIDSEVIAQQVINKVNHKFIERKEKGQPNGVATLNENGKVPSTQLPPLDFTVNEIPIDKQTPTPTKNGVFIPTQIGVYPNFGGLEYTQQEFDNNDYVRFIFIDGRFEKQVKSFGVEGEINSSDTRAVGGDKIYDYILKEVKTIADLRLLEGEEGQEIRLLGYYKAGDKPPLLYKWVSGVGEDDGGSVILSTGGYWEALFSSEINIKHFGAFPTYQYNLEVSEQIQKCFDFAQKDAPTKSYNIYAPFGTYVISKGIDMSANGWGGIFRGDSSFSPYSTLFLAKGVENNIFSMFFVRIVIGENNTLLDRFNKPFNSFALFEIKGVGFNGNAIEMEAIDKNYPTKTTATYGLDVSAAYSVNINNCSFEYLKVGCAFGKWNTVFEHNSIKKNIIGAEVSINNNNNNSDKQNINLALSLASNGTGLYKNNFFTNKNHVIIGQSECMWIKENVFDICYGTSITAKDIHSLIINDNYFEAPNIAERGSNIRYTNLDNTYVDKNISAGVVLYSSSSYQDNYSYFEFKNNQCVNGSPNPRNPFLAISGIRRFNIEGTTFRGKKNGGILFFGVGTRLNNFSNLLANSKIKIDRVNGDAGIIQFESDIIKPLLGFQIVDSKGFNISNPIPKKDFIYNNTKEFVEGNTSAPTTQRPSNITYDTNSYYEKVNFKTDINRFMYKKFTKDIPSVIYISMLIKYIQTETIQARLRIVKDGVVFYNSDVQRFVNGECDITNMCFYLGDCNELEVYLNLWTSALTDFSIENFCINSNINIKDFRVTRLTQNTP